ncbi:MAG: SRPBCC family protein [Actinomadura sp.]
MAPISTSIEVDRPAAEVFAYATDPTRFSEWQQGVVDGHLDGPGTPTVGARCLTTRRIGFADRQVTSVLTHIDPPRTWGVGGTDGPIRARVDVTVETRTATRSRLTIDVDFEGHGIGRILVPLAVRPQARKEMPANLARLKHRIETTSTEAQPGSTGHATEGPSTQQR